MDFYFLVMENQCWKRGGTLEWSVTQLIGPAITTVTFIHCCCKLRDALIFWYWFTQTVLGYRPLNKWFVLKRYLIAWNFNSDTLRCAVKRTCRKILLPSRSLCFCLCVSVCQQDNKLSTNVNQFLLEGWDEWLAKTDKILVVNMQMSKQVNYITPGRLQTWLMIKL